MGCRTGGSNEAGRLNEQRSRGWTGSRGGEGWVSDAHWGIMHRRSCSTISYVLDDGTYPFMKVRRKGCTTGVRRVGARRGRSKGKIIQQRQNEINEGNCEKIDTRSFPAAHGSMKGNTGQMNFANFHAAKEITRDDGSPDVLADYGLLCE